MPKSPTLISFPSTTLTQGQPKQPTPASEAPKDSSSSELAAAHAQLQQQTEKAQEQATSIAKLQSQLEAQASELAQVGI